MPRNAGAGAGEKSKHNDKHCVAPWAEISSLSRSRLGSLAAAGAGQMHSLTMMCDAPRRAECMLLGPHTLGRVPVAWYSMVILR